MQVEPKVLLENKSIAVLGLSNAGQDFFMPTSWFLPISYHPPMVMVCVGQKRHTHSQISNPDVTEFTLSIPGSHAVIWALGTKSGRDVENKAASLGIEYDKEKLFLKKAIGYVRSKIVERKQYGTHLMVIGEIIESELLDESGGPLHEMMAYSIAGGKEIFDFGADQGTSKEMFLEIQREEK